MLLQGPDTTDDFLGVLLYFRIDLPEVSADAEEVFMQIHDQGALRFLWFSQNESIIIVWCQCLSPLMQSFVHETTEVLSKWGFHLHEWVDNIRDVLQRLPPSGRMMFEV
ncbi:hypothetical protein T265_08272 [Opisthorchis viverrini]|uniref:Uncharacterized protein n=1 Tax=Opisthorchis viverrini TaxID=6198 RepID=A0A074Z9R6_OPIVI|nr:hypothetical protein T265_08272 [Opisthorchis viverrini]KER23976.1 hypothetical protein T265_08272 [Opisthorchis viverrini]